MGSVNPGYINSVSRSYDKRFIATGCDDSYLNIFNSPCIKDNPHVLLLSAHSEPIERIKFNHDDTKLFSIGGEDKAIICWNIVKMIRPRKPTNVDVLDRSIEVETKIKSGLLNQHVHIIPNGPNNESANKFDNSGGILKNNTSNSNRDEKKEKVKEDKDHDGKGFYVINPNK